MLSLVDPASLPAVDSANGLTPPALQPLLAWFHRTFQQTPGPAPASLPDDDALAGAASGVETVVEQLQEAAVARAGTAEQLQAMFVALCRGQGLLVRSVRCAQLALCCARSLLVCCVRHMLLLKRAVQFTKLLVAGKVRKCDDTVVN